MKTRKMMDKMSFQEEKKQDLMNKQSKKNQNQTFLSNFEKEHYKNGIGSLINKQQKRIQAQIEKILNLGQNQNNLLIQEKKYFKQQNKESDMIQENYYNQFDSNENESVSIYQNELISQSSIRQKQEFGNEDQSKNLEKTSRKGPKKRKIRTVVSQQSIMALQHLFQYISTGTAYNGTIITLKDVSKIVNLGYSTILHKYRTYRLMGQVQKGLLIQCKDIKRKYGKSLIIQNYIIQSMKQKKFRTAKQLAQYITKKYNFKVNRSIISRHLNQMHRQKQQFIEQQSQEIQQKQMSPNTVSQQVGLKQQKKIQTQEQSLFGRYLKCFFGLKDRGMDIRYVSIINVYIQNNQFFMDIQNELSPIQILRFLILSTQNQLIYYQCQQNNKEQLQLMNQKRNIQFIKQTIQQDTYNYLYNNIHSIVQKNFQQQLQRVYYMFPFSQKQSQYIDRKKVTKSLNKNTFLTLPYSYFNKTYNFIRQWFVKEIFYKFKYFKYPNKLYEKLVEEKSTQKVSQELDRQNQVNQILLSENKTQKIDKESIKMEFSLQDKFNNLTASPKQQTLKKKLNIQIIKEQMLNQMKLKQTKLSKYSNIMINNLAKIK